MTIYFYSKSDAFHQFSNFSPHGFELAGKYWRTVEHYFQAQKFAGTEWEDRVRRAPSPADAKKLGRTREMPLRPDWEQVKDGIMAAAVSKKFASHRELVELLLSTGDESLAEKAPRDYYWGVGADGSGQNKLGQILMQLRSELQNR